MSAERFVEEQDSSPLSTPSLLFFRSSGLTVSCLRVRPNFSRWAEKPHITYSSRFANGKLESAELTLSWVFETLAFVSAYSTAFAKRKQPFGPTTSVGPRNTAGGVIARTRSFKLSLPETARIPVSIR